MLLSNRVGINRFQFQFRAGSILIPSDGREEEGGEGGEGGGGREEEEEGGGGR